MNREAEIERCAKDVLQMAEYGQIDSCTFKGNQVMEALRQALALPKQEPFAWVVTCCDERYYVDMIDDPELIYDIKNHGATYEPLYTSPNNQFVEANKKVDE